MTDPVDLACLGKFKEELGECTSAAARCSIQGIDEAEPTTGKLNKRWLEEEIADVLATADWVIRNFDLDPEFIGQRADKKVARFDAWQAMIEQNAASNRDQTAL